MQLIASTVNKWFGNSLQCRKVVNKMMAGISGQHPGSDIVQEILNVFIFGRFCTPIESRLQSETVHKLICRVCNGKIYTTHLKNNVTAEKHDVILEIFWTLQQIQQQSLDRRQCELALGAMQRRAINGCFGSPTLDSRSWIGS